MLGGLNGMDGVLREVSCHGVVTCGNSGLLGPIGFTR
jgi:hypothetical protein